MQISKDFTPIVLVKTDSAPVCLTIFHDKIWGGFSDGTIRLFDNLECVKIVKQHKDSVRCLIIFDGYICSGSADSNIILWDKDGYHVKVLEGHENVVTCFAILDEMLYSGSWDATIRVWNKMAHCTSVLKCNDIVNHLTTWNNDLYYSSGKNIYKWDLRKLTLIIFQKTTVHINQLIVYNNMLCSVQSSGMDAWSNYGAYRLHIIFASVSVINGILWSVSDGGVIRWELRCSYLYFDKIIHNPFRGDPANIFHWKPLTYYKKNMLLPLHIGIASFGCPCIRSIFHKMVDEVKPVIIYIMWIIKQVGIPRDIAFKIAIS